MLPHSRHIRRQSATQRNLKPRHRKSFQQLNSQILMLLLLLRPVASWNPTPQSTSTVPRQFWSLTSTRRFHLHRNPQPRWATCQRRRWNHPGAPLSPDTRALFPSVGTPTPGTGLFLLSMYWNLQNNWELSLVCHWCKSVSKRSPSSTSNLKVCSQCFWSLVCHPSARGSKVFPLNCYIVDDGLFQLQLLGSVWPKQLQVWAYVTGPIYVEVDKPLFFSFDHKILDPRYVFVHEKGFEESPHLLKFIEKYVWIKSCQHKERSSKHFDAEEEKAVQI